jgi:hypothetical protein
MERHADGRTWVSVVDQDGVGQRAHQQHLQPDRGRVSAEAGSVVAYRHHQGLRGDVGGHAYRSALTRGVGMDDGVGARLRDRKPDIVHACRRDRATGQQPVKFEADAQQARRHRRDVLFRIPLLTILSVGHSLPRAMPDPTGSWAVRHPSRSV